MRSLFLISAAVVSIFATPAFAQSGLEGRVGRLESELRAVQRKVFPGGAGTYVEPQITPSTAPTGPGPGTPATSAVADLSSRVASLEGQIAALTGQIEQNQYRVRQLEDSFAAYRRATDARLSAGAPANEPALEDAPPLPRATGALRPPATRATPTPAATPPRDPARAERLAAVERPDSGDAAEDAYLYGYRLWEAKLYPEAATQLKSVATQYPKHRRASYAQNLLGRSYLDDNKPSLASIAFYDNYKKLPDGERAPDSLYYLASALIKLNKPADACKVYDELSDVYGTKLSDSRRAEIQRGRTTAKCTS